MHFLLKVNWQIFRILLFYDYFILREDLVIKIEHVNESCAACPDDYHHRFWLLLQPATIS
jgi:hypothetical protein